MGEFQFSAVGVQTISGSLGGMEYPLAAGKNERPYTDES